MKLTGRRKSRTRGLAIAMTLFFVLIAFFAASSLLARSHYEAQATIMDTASIQREALARSALASGLAILESAGTEETFKSFSLAGPGGMEARVWLEHEGDDLFRMYAEVKGGMGRPYLAQKVLRKKPQLTAIDMVHLLDGDLQTADRLRYRVVGSDDWVTLPSEKTSLMWVEVDRRGNVISHYFPVMASGHSAELPDGFIARLIEKNDEFTKEGKIEHGFIKKVSLAIEENWDLNLNKPLSTGYAGNAGNAGYSPNPTTLPPSPALETNPDFIRPARVVADALTEGAAIELYSQESGEWNTLSLDLSGEPSGGIPGPATSDGKGLYFPILKPGADSLRHYDFETKNWSEMPSPPSLVGSGDTEHLLELKVDDDGRVYAHHGDDGQYGLSVFDPVKKNWNRLPDPRGLYVDTMGREAEVSPTAADWGNLEVDDQGNVFVIWRTGNDTQVLNHLAKSQTVPGGGPGSGFPIPPFTPKPQPNAGGANPAYGGTQVGGGVTIANGGYGGGAGTPGNTGNAGFFPGNAGSVQPGVVQPPTPGQPPFISLLPGGGSMFAEKPVDMILKLSDGEWSAIRPPVGWSESLGSISAGVDGRLLIHILNPLEDKLYAVNSNGAKEAPSEVPEEDGNAALYFGSDTGARKVAGRYSFQETADY